MLRIAVLALFLVGCSKSKEAPKETTPTPSTAQPAAGSDAEPAGSAAPAAEAGSAEASTEGTAAAGSADAIVAASDFKFDKLSSEDKVKFMKQKVMPAMKPLFQKFDPKEFGNVTCKTCHGKDPQGSKYKMPSPDLPALDFDAIKAGKEDPKMVEFMAKVVKPEMAKLLNEPEMTESQPKGFGCLDCHEMKKKK